MKLTVPVKLDTSELQFQALYETLVEANRASNWISEQAWATKTFRQFDLHKLVYQEVRQRFELSAQLTVRCIAKVAHSYQLDKKAQRKFKSEGATPYDSRILLVRPEKQYVTIWTLLGRIKIPFLAGDYQKQHLGSKVLESDLVLRDRAFYLHLVYEIPEKDIISPEGILGVDLGIVNIATTSDGTNYSGAKTNSLRKRYRNLRSKLQAKGTRSAKRLLKKRRRKERNFNRNTNHVISKKIVQQAKCTNQAIALENLKGIRLRTKVRKLQRNMIHGWAFYQLTQFIQCKAKLEGIPVVLVDPRHTSQECPQCHSVDKKNRRTRDEFKCKSCGFAGPADYVAALNIQNKATAAVNQPNVSAA